MHFLNNVLQCTYCSAYGAPWAFFSATFNNCKGTSNIKVKRIMYC